MKTTSNMSVTSAMQSRVFDSGVRARSAGKGRNECALAKGSQARKWWQNGWDSADRADKEANKKTIKHVTPFGVFEEFKVPK